MEAHVKHANAERMDLRRRIENEVEEGISLRSTVHRLTTQMESMVSLQTVQATSQQLADLVEITREMQRELITNICKRRDALDISNTLLNDEKNLGVLLGSNESLYTMTDPRNVKGFLERWAAGKIDPGGEEAAAEAS